MVVAAARAIPIADLGRLNDSVAAGGRTVAVTCCTSALGATLVAGLSDCYRRACALRIALCGRSAEDIAGARIIVVTGVRALAVAELGRLDRSVAASRRTIRVCVDVCPDWAASITGSRAGDSGVYALKVTC